MIKQTRLSLTMRIFLRFALPLVVLAIWILFTYEYRDPRILLKNTEKLIRSNDQLIQMYVRKYGRAPASLNELRLYAKLNGKHYLGYDSWGERLEYLPLGKINYTLRSFGEDGDQNTFFTESDPGVFRWGQMVSQGLQYNYSVAGVSKRPSVVLFAEADSPDRKWHAKLFLDQSTGSRKLLVRHKIRQKLYMLAPHDAIEEFLWLPTGDRLVFTASGSARYGDGVWIWDINSDRIWNLLELEQDSGGYNPASQARSLHVALAYVTNDNFPKIAAYIADGSIRPIDPKWFFSPKHLNVFEIGMSQSVKRIKKDLNPAEEKASYFDYAWLTRGTILTDGVGSSMQREWLSLPRTGNWESAMQKWQTFAARYPHSPLAAYSIWSLSMFYRDAQLAQAAGRPKEAEILRSFSLELGNALSRLVSAPGWMRALTVDESASQ